MIAKDLDDGQAEEVQHRKTGERRPCRPGDIALLAPTGSDLWRYEEALERRGIPVATQAGKGLFRRQEIQDLIALTLWLNLILFVRANVQRALWRTYERSAAHTMACVRLIACDAIMRTRGRVVRYQSSLRATARSDRYAGA